MACADLGAIGLVFFGGTLFGIAIGILLIGGVMVDRIKDIPANPNPIENGITDPTPEKGKGGWLRAIVSALKGWRS